jgi:bifunctional DNA-binding transcriptional regulator/antitoxin component of YhaV-PrlF toxin-antitoxin module
MSDLFRLKIVSKRQVTIPQRAMDLLRLRTGDEIHFKVANGRIVEAYPVPITPDLEMSEDAQQRFEQIEKETSASGAPDVDLTDLIARSFPSHPSFQPPPSVGQFPVCRVSPRNFQRSDERIAELVAEGLASTHLDISDIEIHVKNGEVTLLGTMNDGLGKFIAEGVARNVLGVKDVDNQILVVARFTPYAETRDQPRLKAK